MSKNKQQLMEDQRAKELTFGRKVSVIKDDGMRVETTVRLKPWRLGHGAWVVGLEGISGGYSVSRVVPI